MDKVIFFLIMIVLVGAIIDFVYYYTTHFLIFILLAIIFTRLFKYLNTRKKDDNLQIDFLDYFLINLLVILSVVCFSQLINKYFLLYNYNLYYIYKQTVSPKVNLYSSITLLIISILWIALLLFKFIKCYRNYKINLPIIVVTFIMIINLFSVLLFDVETYNEKILDGKKNYETLNLEEEDNKTIIKTDNKVLARIPCKISDLIFFKDISLKAPVVTSEGQRVKIKNKIYPIYYILGFDDVIQKKYTFTYNPNITKLNIQNKNNVSTGKYASIKEYSITKYLEMIFYRGTYKMLFYFYLPFVLIYTIYFNTNVAKK